MLKRIGVEQLRLGMHIHEFCGSWMDHPFWRGAFLLDDPKDLQTILSTGLKEAWIDTSKGLDVDGGTTREAVAAEVEATLAQVEVSSKPETRANIAQEAARAVKICAQSKQAVASMFHEARMGKALDVGDALPIVEEISTSVMRNPGALISLARLKNKDEYTYMHSVAVCALMVSLARTMGFNDEQTRQAGLAGLLHDVGKMMIPPEILDKPGKLTEAEFDTMKSHPAEGHRMLLEGVGIGELALDVCLHHHEKVDGSGYPDGLAGGEISLYARMGAVCDVYDAITSNRPYKNGWEPAESIRKMAEWSKGHFDQRIFEAFVRSIGIYPIGSLVRLESEMLGVVIEQNEQSLLKPMLMVFFSIKSNGRVPPVSLDLSKPACKDKIVSHEDPAKWDIRDTQALWSGLAVTPW
ncbi:MAG: HD-GYP domain-containing protein [Gallionella sp.]|jgi:putative nucleotidyltransferase with HDIG domain|nr:HD-GYP domain-containing protein [Gallionella sp.]MCK9352757.1 HD-GYP domain-containing protein [Gallionella sp.]